MNDTATTPDRTDVVESVLFNTLQLTGDVTTKQLEKGIKRKEVKGEKVWLIGHVFLIFQKINNANSCQTAARKTSREPCGSQRK